MIPFIFCRKKRCLPMELFSQVSEFSDVTAEIRNLWRISEVSAEGARRQPNLSGKRTEWQFHLCMGLSRGRGVRI